MKHNVNNRSLSTAILVMAVLIQLLMTISVIALQVDALNARKTSSAQRELTIKQNNYIICILKIQPEQRTDAVLDDCKDSTIGK